MITNELRHAYTDPYDIPMSELRHWDYIGETLLPPDTYNYETLGDFIEHYGVKGMRWRHRKDKEMGVIDPSFMKMVRVAAANAAQAVTSLLNGDFGKIRLVTPGKRRTQSTSVSTSSFDRLRSSSRR